MWPNPQIFVQCNWFYFCILYWTDALLALIGWLCDIEPIGSVAMLGKHNQNRFCLP